MSDTHDTAFTGSIPAVYEQYLVPLLFAPYAEELARRVRDLDGHDVLELAGGTGVLTRALAAALPRARITATDLNGAMLDVARARAPASHVSWQVADAQRLPFPDASFDAVVHQFGAMFFPDKVGAYAEARRVLRPGGRLVFAVWGAIADNEATRAVQDAVQALFPQDPPSFLPRTPFAYFDHARLRSDVEAAGFADVQVEDVDATTTTTVDDAARGYCQGCPLRDELEARAPGELAATTARVADRMRAAYGATTVANRMRAVVVTARR